MFPYIWSFHMWTYTTLFAILLLKVGDIVSTEAQRKASRKYLGNMDEIRIRLKQDGTKEKIASFAKNRGLSVNAYILGLIEADMKLSEEPKE